MRYRQLCSPAYRAALTWGLTLFAGFANLPNRPATASELRETPIVKVINAARESIVNIQGEKTVAQDDGTHSQGEPYRRVNGMGTGVVIDARGYLLTNHHVVDGVRRINVALADKRNFTATVIARDPQTDLAILKIDSKEPLPVISIGTSSDLMLGESVIAVGNAYGYDHTATRGIVSALHRSVQVSDVQNYDDLIQTDASINPGNSGGPLMNIDGEMVGIVVAVRAGAQGIGFAIPVDKAMTVAAEMLNPQSLGVAWHGVEAKHLAGKSPGFVIDRLAESSPAATAGLEPGDTVLSVDGEAVERPLDFERALLGRRAGEEVKVRVDRNGDTKELALTLATLPGGMPVDSDPVWGLLGLKLKPIPSKQFQQYRSRYRGGLTVLEVRPDGPAAKQGIRRGDVLVGMHVWETISLNDVSYVLNREDFVDLDPLKFYILRDNETLFGHMTVSRRLQK
jgi:serine protease Do